MATESVGPSATFTAGCYTMVVSHQNDDFSIRNASLTLLWPGTVWDPQHLVRLAATLQ
jgi:hypothetical protein